MANWQVQEAKAHLSEVIKQAALQGPQVITNHGAERAVLLSMDDYRTLSSNRKDLKAHLLGGPKFDDVEIERSRDVGREIEL